MIKIVNVNKFYNTKNSEVHALKDINLTLPNQGMIFIVGKSGCGKSTLLNLIGGLDKIDHGNILVNDRSLSSFSVSEIDVYRNHDIGFVFQDYSLLYDVSVFDNIDLALALQGKKNNEKRIKEILDAVDLEDVSKRRPRELSGGQQQRVAIARALIKNPQIILADEPTGNLDSETSEQIFSILRKLSQKKLIIIVSHDMEAAYKYGDRIIELNDGEIISDLLLNQVFESEHDKKQYTKATLPNKVTLLLSFANMKIRFFRIMITMLIFFLSILVSIQVITIMQYQLNNAIYHTTIHNQYDFLTLYPTNVSEYGQIVRGNSRLNRKVVENIYERYPNYNFLKSNQKIESVSELKSFGFEFYDGYIEIDDESIVVSDLYVDKMYYANINFKNEYPLNKIYYLVENDKEIIINPRLHHYHDLIGKNIISYEFFGEMKMKAQSLRIAAIYKTEYQDYLDSNFEKKQEIDYHNFSVWESIEIIYQVFTTANYITKDDNSNNPIISSADFSYNNYAYYLFNHKEERIYVDLYLGLVQNNINYSNYIITDSGFLDKDYLLKDDEVVISLRLYNILMNESNRMSSFISSYDPIFLKFPELIGEEINYQILDRDYDRYNYKLIIDKKVKIIGVDLSNEFQSVLYLNNNHYDNAYYLKDNRVDFLSVYLNGDYSELRNLLNDLADNRIYPFYAHLNSIYFTESYLYSSMYIILGITILLIIITVLMLTNIIYIGVADKKRDIGILKALGCSNFDIYKIYLFESLLIGAIPLLLSVIFMPIFVEYFNWSLNTDSYPYLRMVSGNIMIYLYLIFLTLVIPIIATILPIKLIVRLKPSEVIRNSDYV